MLKVLYVGEIEDSDVVKCMRKVGILTVGIVCSLSDTSRYAYWGGGQLQ